MVNLELVNVTKVIHKNTVIDGVTFSLQSGNIYGFQGINGSGKTMLMRLISGLIRPTQGRITVNNKILGKDITFPGSIGMLLENPSFLDGYSGFNNLKMLASIQKKIDADEVRRAIKSVGLNPDEKKKYRKYSLGMKQRLGIACAIMEKPDIVILDEPTNSLDTDGVNLVKSIVMQEKKRGALVIISCHDLSILQNLSDEIVLLKDGKMTEHIIMKDIQKRSQHEKKVDSNHTDCLLAN